MELNSRDSRAAGLERTLLLEREALAREKAALAALQQELSVTALQHRSQLKEAEARSVDSLRRVRAAEEKISRAEHQSAQLALSSRTISHQVSFILS